ncbi:hypothetical protein EVAR_6682_1 [Eumeta japonica]|uniref:Uncharacterized protein n=1 Tax=Eumeta variegata TaxID=151549 RepID=A0A4C1TND3_EUMVA|nr:hypothetical protein EVAR_6682_1 [Eumeta japonica]
MSASAPLEKDQNRIHRSHHKKDALETKYRLSSICRALQGLTHKVIPFLPPPFPAPTTTPSPNPACQTPSPPLLNP